MSRNQVILLFFLSIFFGLGAVFFAKQWMDRQTQPQVEVEVVEREPVVIATQEIKMGTVVTASVLTTKLLEKSWRSEEQYTDVNDLIGQVVENTIFPGEIISVNRVTTPGEGATLAALIPENKRAVTIRVNDVIGVAGFLLPGNKVDVLNTVKSNQNYVDTKTVLKDIKVLAVDQTAKADENKPIIVRAVTLEVSPTDAEKLLSARSRGEIQLTLRNPHEKPQPVVRSYVAPSVTVIKGTESSNIRVSD